MFTWNNQVYRSVLWSKTYKVDVSSLTQSIRGLWCNVLQQGHYLIGARPDLMQGRICWYVGRIEHHYQNVSCHNRSRIGVQVTLLCHGTQGSLQGCPRVGEIWVWPSNYISWHGQQKWECICNLQSMHNLQTRCQCGWNQGNDKVQSIALPLGVLGIAVYKLREIINSPVLIRCPSLEASMIWW